LHANGQIIREATLTRLLEVIFQPYTDLARTGDPKRTVIRGPGLMIGERALTSLALVLHELTTNAAKYGALSIGEGLVHVSWQIEADNFLLRWEEHKGPGIEKTPTSEGFGSILVRRTIVGQLGGELDYILEARGVFCLYFDTDGTSFKLKNCSFATLRLLAKHRHGSDVPLGELRC
jgi:two-component sensor histidine kinase